MGRLWEWVDSTLALTSDSADVGHVLVRCVVFYLATLAMVRMGNKRFIGRHTAFDLVLAIMLGSVASRAITDGTTALGKITAAFVLVVLHTILSKLSFHSDWIGPLIKGSPRVLVRDGQIQWDAMAKASISEKDLQGMLRSDAGSRNLEEVELAHLERSGDVSFIMRETDPQVIDVAVEDGVQMISIRIS